MEGVTRPARLLRAPRLFREGQGHRFGGRAPPSPRPAASALPRQGAAKGLTRGPVRRSQGKEPGRSTRNRSTQGPLFRPNRVGEAGPRSTAPDKQPDDGLAAEQAVPVSPRQHERGAGPPSSAAARPKCDTMSDAPPPRREGQEAEPPGFKRFAPAAIRDRAPVSWDCPPNPAGILSRGQR